MSESEYMQCGAVAEKSGCSPDILVIGATKGGSTVTFSQVKDHQCVRMMNKEVHYFTYGFDRISTPDYEKAIGCTAAMERGERRFMTGEGTPEYLYLPGVPERVFSKYPNVKLVVMLRRPLDRSYSHFNMARRSGRRTVVFEQVSVRGVLRWW